ncbi:MAG: arginine--tRNA ligase [Alphaproteobacteria bacterium]|nr:arginine--tRNA ligase [Alphaproteobacteria bacterium]
MASIAEKLTGILEEVFVALDLPRELARVQVSGQGQAAQFQCNGAFQAAKAARANPREIAQKVVDRLGDVSVFSKVEIGGPGFINIDVMDAFIAAHLRETAAEERLGVSASGAGQTIVLDYGGPNIAKAMHVGHLRSSIIGDSLRRMYLFAGFEAIGDVHMGDWGTPMGMILSELDISGYDGPITMDYLAEIYPKAASACKEDEVRMALAREATRKLQDGDVGYTRRWRSFIDVSIAGMKANFDQLGVHFDEWKGESDAHPFIAGMIADLKAQGLAVESDGALVVAVAQDGDKKEIPPLILLKSDGAVLYGTTDLATIVERVSAHQPFKILYIVDQRQALHFEQVFRAARLGKIAPEGQVDLVHAGFGTMNGPDGKPFKTRAGGVMRLEDLIAQGIEKAQGRLDEAELAKDMDAGEREAIAQKVAIAALKFADLQNNRIADYVFDIDRMTSFEGKTGPYLLYQAVRIRSLLKKAGWDEAASADFVMTDTERELALLLAEWPDHFAAALKHDTPHVLCDYAYRLAQEFSSFYGRCHILSEEDEALRASRLALCALTQKQICMVLALLGIDVPERM